MDLGFRLWGVTNARAKTVGTVPETLIVLFTCGTEQ